MPLKITIKEDEAFFVGGAALKNVSGQPVDLVVINKVPILRGNAIMKPEQADTPVKRIYFEIQSMYMFGASHERFQTLARLMAELIEAAPSLAPDILGISLSVQDRDIYPALKQTEKLMKKEAAMLEHARAIEEARAAGMPPPEPPAASPSPRRRKG